MRWESLFDDLESQLERELSAEELDIEVEEERLRLARLGLRDRIVASAGAPLVVLLAGGGRYRIRVADVGRDWVAADGDEVPAWSGIIPIGAIESLSLSPDAARSSLRAAGGEHPALTERLGLSFVLRDLCRRRRYVAIDLGAGVLSGTIDRVGRDHLDLAVHPPDTPRRESEVSEVRVIATDSVRLVRLR